MIDSILHNWFNSLPIVTIVSKTSGTKFLPVIVINVPPPILPVFGDTPVITTSKAKSFAVYGEAIALPNPSLMTLTSKSPGRPPGIPALMKVSLTERIFIW